MKTAIASMIVSTPAYPDADVKGVASNLRDNASIAGARANALETLAAKGWTMHQPVIVPDSTNPQPGTDYYDVIVYLTKEFEGEDEAIVEARTCGATIELNFSFGWNADGTTNEIGVPNVEWWCEA